VKLYFFEGQQVFISVEWNCRRGGNRVSWF